MCAGRVGGALNHSFLAAARYRRRYPDQET